MTYSTQDTQDFALPLPITQLARSTAQQFASEQPTRQKADQVRLNTLAVAVVNDYLQLMGIATDLAASDSWNPVLRLCADIADLYVVGAGRLECRPLESSVGSCPIPPEVWEDRIGYLIVQIDEALAEAKVLGFVPKAAVEELPLSQLQPPEDLLDYLNRLMQAIAAGETVDLTEQRLVNLSQWFQQLFEASWQTVESLLSPSELTPAYSFRSAVNISSTETESAVQRAKLIDLGIQLNNSPVVLLVEVSPTANQLTHILLQVHPTNEQSYLPPDLRLLVLDESGTTFLEAQSRTADNYIQLQFSGSVGERFGIQVALGDASVVEEFVI